MARRRQCHPIILVFSVHFGSRRISLECALNCAQRRFSGTIVGGIYGNILNAFKYIRIIWVDENRVNVIKSNYYFSKLLF